MSLKTNIDISGNKLDDEVLTIRIKSVPGIGFTGQDDNNHSFKIFKSNMTSSLDRHKFKILKKAMEKGYVTINDPAFFKQGEK